MRQKIITLSILILLISNNGKTIAQVVYGLNECISIGLERNFSILVAKNSEAISTNNFTPGNAGYLPTLSLSSRYSGTLNNTTQNMPDGTQNITSGTNTNSVSGSASLGMTIFNGFNVQTTYRKLNELKQLGELNTQLTIENYISTVIAVYYNYVQQVEQYSNLLYALTLSRERLRIDEDRYLLGSNSKLQVLQSQVYLNADSSRLVKQLQVLKETQIRLNELMAVEDIGTEFVSKDTTIDLLTDLLYEKLLDETLGSNTSLLIAGKNKVISEYDYKLAVSRSYPYLDFNGGYNYTLSTNSTASYKNQVVNGMNYGLTFGVTLFDGFNLRRQIRNSAIEIQNKELKYSEVEQGVKADLLAIFTAYRNNLGLIKLEEQNLETATENLDIALEKYRLGGLSGIDLREVQKSLLDAKERLISVQYQAKLAEISLFQISGNIMKYF
jgi:outer membrane protein TolC